MTGPSASTEKVVILGGAIVGSFVAYFLQELGFGGQIQIVERDPTYQFSSTALSAAAIRTQFSCAINIRMSLFGADFFRNIENRFGPKADIGFHENGYLILGSPEGAAARSAGLAMQVAAGAEVLALDPRQLLARFPWLNVEGLGLSTLEVRNEGWFDAWSMLSLVRNRVRSRGGVYVTAEVQSFILRGGSIAGVRLSNGQSSRPIGA